MAAPTLADQIRALRQRHGSHDKLAAALKAKGMKGASRTLIINWEQGTVPSTRYRVALVKLGVPESAFKSARAKEAETRRSYDRRLRKLEDEALTTEDLAPLLLVVQLLAAGKRAEAQRALSEAGLAQG